MKTFFAVAIIASIASLASAQQKCGEDGKITIIGSSTVFPVSAAFSAEYSKLCPNNSFDTRSGGSSAGANSVCAVPGTDVSDIGNMSREWRETEASTTDTATYTCLKGDTTRTVVQIPVALDGVPIFVGKSSTILTACLASLPNGLTSAELRWMFSNLTDIEQPAFSDKKANTWLWSELCGTKPGIPANQKINIYGPEAIYGTHDYFKEVIFTGGDGFRSDIKYYPDNDAPLRDAVANDPFGIGFFGYSYFRKNTNLITALKIDGIEPTDENLFGGTYLPLGRRIYSNYFTGSLKKTSCYGQFGLTATGARLVDATGFLPIPEEEYPVFINRLGACGPSEAPTLAPTARPPACKRFCFFFQRTCCNQRRKNAGTCSCSSN